jgi:hypothetical protein
MWWGGLKTFCLLSYLLYFSTYFLLYFFQKSSINKWETELLDYACIKFSRKTTNLLSLKNIFLKNIYLFV